MVESIKPPTFQVRRAEGVDKLILESRIGHRKTLRDIFIINGVAGYITIQIGNVIVFSADDNLSQAKLIGNHWERLGNEGTLSYLARNIPDLPRFTAAQDEDIIIQRDSAADFIEVRYEDTVDEFVAHDIDGGSGGVRHLMIISMANNTAISATGEFSFDRLRMPSGLPPFTEGVDEISSERRIVENQRFVCYFLAGDFPKSGSSKTRFLYLREDTVMLFTSEKGDGMTVDIDFGGALQFDLQPLMTCKLVEPYEFVAGKTYGFKGYAYFDGTNTLPALSQRLYLIGIREYIV